ncbi:CII family transcriptional regulator [Burkholderia gladioli]|jgi:hypothetical protein|uniref:CII family transcriptional regulator n=1 Tax=Burkholderia gladioli TaxID=28095 RepID=UPI0015E79968|nr:CII family transcriptional regulator [Burkholderia gladioli]MBA1364064.1 MarR family transcriptional regulator [Burkholderia gladioli]
MSTPAEAVSSDDIENTRKLGARIEGEVLRAIARSTQAHAAACLGVSASTVSRMLEDLPRWAVLLAAVGLQPAPVDAIVVEQKELQSLELMALKYLQSKHQQW